MSLTPASALAGRLSRAVADQRVLAALASVPRERFVPAHERAHAYDNVALPIGHGQTISQPVVVARMLETLELRAEDRVLDIGTGSGYHAALLALLVSHVWTIEAVPELSQCARQAIGSLGIGNVTFVVGDGGRGLPDEAPFDAINVAAATGSDAPSALLEQLEVGGRLVAPVGDRDQRLTLFRRAGPESYVRKRFEAVRFVPLVRPSA